MAGCMNLPYLREVVGTRETIGKYQIVDNADIYRGESIRNRVIVKLDLIDSMTKYFTPEILKAYRDVIFDLMSVRITDKERISKLFTALYSKDYNFKKYLTQVVYESNLLEKSCLFRVIVDQFKNDYSSRMSYLMETLRLQRCVILFDSCGYLYVAVPDERVNIRLPYEIRREVLSRGKVWKGEFYWA